MSIDFSGSTQNLDFDGSNIDVSKRISFSIFVYRNANATFRRIFMINANATDPSGFQIVQDFDGIQSFNMCASNGASVWGNQPNGRFRVTSAANNVWHNICGTVSADSIPGNGLKTVEASFINGVAMSAGGDTFTKGTSNARVYVAARSDDTSYFDGRCAEATIWEDGRILTLEDAKALFAGAPSTFIQPDKMKFYAPLHELDGVDFITGNAATKTGSPVTAGHPPMTGSHYSFVPGVAAAASAASLLLIQQSFRQ